MAAPGIREEAGIVKNSYKEGWPPDFGAIKAVASVLQERKNRKGRRLQAEREAAANSADSTDPAPDQTAKPTSSAPVTAALGSPIGDLHTPGPHLGGAQFTRYMGRHRALPVPPMSLVREARLERSQATADIHQGNAHVADVARAKRASQSGMPWLGRISVPSAGPEGPVTRIGGGVYSMAKAIDAHNTRSRSQTVAAQNGARHIQAQIEDEIDQNQINTTPRKGNDDDLPFEQHPNTKILPEDPDQNQINTTINTTPATPKKKPGAHKKQKKVTA